MWVWYGLITMANNTSKAADLTITIIGRPGVGKTTLVLALQEFLLLRGFTDVSVLDPDLPRGHGTPTEVNDLRLATIAGKDPSVCIAAVCAPKHGGNPLPNLEALPG